MSFELLLAKGEIFIISILFCLFVFVFFVHLFVYNMVISCFMVHVNFANNKF